MRLSWKGGGRRGEPSGCALCHTFDVVEGALRCEGCGANFPIINGVPRLLRGALLARLQPRYPSFFARHPEFLPPTATARDPLADIFESFTRQRLDLRPPGPDFAHEWAEHLRRNLGSALSLESLNDQLILASAADSGGISTWLVSVVPRSWALISRQRSTVARHLNVHNLRYNPSGEPLDASFRFPFPEGSFDLIYLYSVFSHMISADIRVYLHDFQRLLGRTGWVCFTRISRRGRAGDDE